MPLTDTAASTTVDDAQPGSVRCSDAERETTSRRLHAAIGEGRLTLDEMTDRLDAVYTARYRHELDALTTDLPAVPRDSRWAHVRAVIQNSCARLLTGLAFLTTRADDRSTRRRKIAIWIAIAAVLLLGTAAVVFAIVTDGGPGLHHGIADQDGA